MKINTGLSEIATHFLNLYHFLSKTAKAVFKYLQFMAKKYRAPFPAIETIALAVKCSKRQVIRIINQLESCGWLIRRKRKWQSNVYLFHQDILLINVEKPATFRNPEHPPFCSENVTQNVTLLSSYSEKRLSTSTSKPVPAQKAPLKRPIDPRLKQMKRLDDDQRETLTNHFSEYAINQAIEEAAWYRKEGNIIANLGGYLWKAAKRATEKFKKRTI